MSDIASRAKKLLRRAAETINGGRVFKKVTVEPHVTLDRCELIGDITVGYRSYANNSCLKDVAIGRYCSIGRNCSVGAAKHALDGLTTSPIGEDASFHASPVTTLGNDVWIGDGAIIFSGTMIGHGAVIGAGAIVTRDVPPYAIVAGVPARVIRYRFDDDTIARLLRSAWWDFGDQALAYNRPPGFDGIEDLPDELTKVSFPKKRYFGKSA